MSYNYHVIRQLVLTIKFYIMKLKMKAVGTTLHLKDREFNNTKYVAEVVRKEKNIKEKFNIELYQKESSIIIKINSISYEVKRLSKESVLKLINKVTESNFTELDVC